MRLWKACGRDRKVRAVIQQWGRKQSTAQSSRQQNRAMETVLRGNTFPAALAPRQVLQVTLTVLTLLFYGVVFLIGLTSMSFFYNKTLSAEEN